MILFISFAIKVLDLCNTGECVFEKRLNLYNYKRDTNMIPSRIDSRLVSKSLKDAYHHASLKILYLPSPIRLKYVFTTESREA